jgi:hypothetical protein
MHERAAAFLFHHDFLDDTMTYGYFVLCPIFLITVSYIQLIFV